MVEDNPGDVRLTREALKGGKVWNQLHVVEDGVAALDFLYQRAPYQQATRPDLVLLDLNLPKKDGREVLAAIKSDPSLKMIPVVILTTSQAEEDVLRAYNLNANCYVTKPVDFDQFTRIVQTIEQFWLTVVTLPPNPPM
jgi:two-component system response regulator